MPFVNPEDILPIADEYGLDRNLLNKVIEAESSWNPDAVSPVGAQGLMQLMPKTAEWLGVKDPFNPEENVRAGAKYLSSLIQRYNGDLVKALAAYNWGPGNVDKWSGNFEDLPHETRNYITKILGDQTLQQRNAELQRSFLRQTGLSPEEAAAEFGGIQPAVNPAEIIAGAAAGGIPSAIRSGASLLGTLGRGAVSGIAATPSAVATEPLIDEAYDYNFLAGLAADLFTAAVSGVTVDKALENALNKYGSRVLKYADDAIKIVQEREVADKLRNWVTENRSKAKDALPDIIDYFQSVDYRKPFVTALDVIESVPAKTANQAKVITNRIHSKLRDGGKFNELELRPLLAAIERKQKIVEDWIRQNPKAMNHIGRLLVALPYGAVAGLGVDEETGQWTFSPERAILGALVGYSIGPRTTIRHIGVLEPTATGRYMRGGKVKTDYEEVWDRFLEKVGRNIIPEVDMVETPEEAKMVAESWQWLHPEVSPKRAKDRYAKPAPTGYYGNVGKMAYPNETYPKGRGSFDNPGCARNVYLQANGVDSNALTYGPCYGFLCYAAADYARYGRVIHETFVYKRIQGRQYKIIYDYIQEHGLEKARAAFPNIKFRYYPDSGRWVFKEIIPRNGALIHTKYPDVGYKDIRLGVDTDGGAFLALQESIDGLKKANIRTLSVYASAYHLIPPEDPELADRTIINVSVSGWHSLPETLHRLKWATLTRNNGWNVILREVVANPRQFAQDKVIRYNRWHSGIMDTDFFHMQQPLHHGSTHGEPLWGIPACCVGSKDHPKTCEDCIVAEGLGRGFQGFWGIVEEPEKGELILPAVKDYQGNRIMTPAR